MTPVEIQYIELRNNRDGQPRAYIAGTRVRVQDVYAKSEIHGRTPEQIAAGLPDLSLAQIHAALAYYFDNRDAILDEMRQDEQVAAACRAATGSGPLEQRLRDQTAADDVVAS